MTVKSFAPGVPAFFLFFLARKEWRSAQAVRNMERRKKSSTSDPNTGIDELMAAAEQRLEGKKKIELPSHAKISVHPLIVRNGKVGGETQRLGHSKRKCGNGGNTW